MKVFTEHFANEILSVNSLHLKQIFLHPDAWHLSLPHSSLWAVCFLKAGLSFFISAFVTTMYSMVIFLWPKKKSFNFHRIFFCKFFGLQIGDYWIYRTLHIEIWPLKTYQNWSNKVTPFCCLLGVWLSNEGKLLVCDFTASVSWRILLTFFSSVRTLKRTFKCWSNWTIINAEFL